MKTGKKEFSLKNQSTGSLEDKEWRQYQWIVKIRYPIGYYMRREGSACFSEQDSTFQNTKDTRGRVMRLMRW